MRKFLIAILIVFSLGIFINIYSVKAVNIYDYSQLEDSKCGGLKSQLQQLKNQYPNYEFKIYDIQGNELKLQNASGQAKTSKVKPTVNVKVKKQDISEVELTLNLKNKDNAEINNYRYALYNVKGELSHSKRTGA